MAASNDSTVCVEPDQEVGTITKGAPCRIVEVAESLVGEIEAYELPPDFDPGDLYYNEILANLRHEYTNYEPILWSLPSCSDHWEQGGECVWDYESDYECHLSREAHDLLKWAAKDAAAEVYQRWLENKEGK